MDGSRQRPPHAWRWAIFFSRFLQSFVCLGSFKSMGVFVSHFVAEFSTAMAWGGLVSSLGVGFGELLAGPFAGALVKVCDARKVNVAGGLVAGVATCLAAFSVTLTQLGVCFAVSSIGVLLSQVASIKPLQDYFPDDFASANGASLAGGTLGMMVLPPVADRLVAAYGWRGAMLCFGALNFHYVVAGALLRPLAKSCSDGTRSLVRRGKDYGGTSFTRMSTEAMPGDGCSSADGGQGAGLYGHVLEGIRELFDWSIMRQPMFYAYNAVTLMCGCVCSMWHLFIVPQGVELGYGDAPAAFLATFGGLGSMLGRLGHGPLVDSGLVGSHLLFALSAGVFAVACLLNPLAASSYAALAASSLVAGLGVGCFYPLVYVIYRGFLGKEHMSAYGWLFSSLGTGLTLGGLFAGWIFDATGDYGTLFIVTGAVSVLMAGVLKVADFLWSESEAMERQQR